MGEGGNDISKTAIFLIAIVQRNFSHKKDNKMNQMALPP